MPEIRPLLISDRHLISEYLFSYPPEISELTFTNLFVWRQSRPIFIAEFEKSLTFLVNASGNRNEYILLGVPLGTVSILEAADFFGKRLAGAVRIPEQSAQSLLEGGFQAEKDRDNADYVYRIIDLAELKGRRYAKKRNHIKHCLQNFHCEYVPITEENIPECIAMQERWCRTRECDLNPGLCSENIAVAETFERYKEFDLIGGAIRVDGEIQAYGIGEQLHPGTAVCHLEKALPGIPGLWQLINQWFAKYSLYEFEFINREQDLGIPGLRHAKESYYPHHLVEKYNVAFTDSFNPRVTGNIRCPSPTLS